MRRFLNSMLIATAATMVLAIAPVAASASVTLDGSFSSVVTKPAFVSLCPSGGGDECDTIQLVGLGTATWAYTFGPTFEPNGRCFNVDGSFSLTLQSDGSSISGPLTGLFCPNPSATAHQHAGMVSYGNPFSEDDTIAFSGGTGRFAGLSGTASFHTRGAGAVLKGTLLGTLSS
jgi:hypothetical protein